LRNLLSALAISITALAVPPAMADPSGHCADLASVVEPVGPPTFVTSYPTVAAGPLHKVAFLYDNALAVIGLVACGENERAKRIGDAMLWALDHDRAWHDGRLRNAYPGGPATDDPIKLSGWYDSGQNKWLEDGYQVGTDSGNMAWAMLALLALDYAGPPTDTRYRDAAARIGRWVAGQRDTRGPGGFLGGFIGWEPKPMSGGWKSTEQNSDLYAAFSLLAERTHDTSWTELAEAARHFIQAMWRPECGCFAVGTFDDGVGLNPVVTLDAQTMPLLALPDSAPHYEGALTASEWRLRVRRAVSGFTYSEVGDAVWTEGTAQMALITHLLGRTDEYSSLMATIDSQKAPDNEYYATSATALATGFGDPTNPLTQRFYYRLPHLAPTAWAAMADRGFNPFTDGGLPQASASAQ